MNACANQTESVVAQTAACATAGWTCRALLAQASLPPQLLHPDDGVTGSTSALVVEKMGVGGRGMGAALSDWLSHTAQSGAVHAQDVATPHGDDRVVMWLDSRDFLLHENVAHEVPAQPLLPPPPPLSSLVHACLCAPGRLHRLARHRSNGRNVSGKD